MVSLETFESYVQPPREKPRDHALGDFEPYPMFICPFTFQRFQCPLSRLLQSSLHFQDYQSLLSCKDNQGHLLFFTFSRLSKSLVMQRQSRSSAFLYIFRTIKVCFHVETIKVIYFIYIFETIKVLSLAETIKVICFFTF